MRTPPAPRGQGSEVPDPTFADGELLPTEPDFFPEDEDEAMTLAPPEGPQESDMEGRMESTRILEGPVGIPAEKDAGLGGLFLPEDKSLGHPPSMTTSDLSTHSTTSLISNEEQFEDYGEADDVDCAPSSPCPDDETRTNVYSDLGSSVSSSAGQTPRKMRHAYDSEPVDVYCSQCCKKISLLNDLEARLKSLKASSPNRKISSTAFGRQILYHLSRVARVECCPLALHSCCQDGQLCASNSDPASALRVAGRTEGMRRPRAVQAADGRSTSRKEGLGSPPAYLVSLPAGFSL
uniref:Uncharacterized protein n=1 Tax=Capra hircus TaxID=9925 RepID=A0A8C2RHV4_CAPHI